MVDSGCDAEHLRQYCDSYRAQSVIPLRTLKRKSEPRLSRPGAINAYPLSRSLRPCAAMNMATADRQ